MSLTSSFNTSLLGWKERYGHHLEREEIDESCFQHERGRERSRAHVYMTKLTPGLNDQMHIYQDVNNKKGKW